MIISLLLIPPAIVHDTTVIYGAPWFNQQAAMVAHMGEGGGFGRAGFLFFVFLSRPLPYLSLGFPRQDMKGLGQRLIPKDPSNTKTS